MGKYMRKTKLAGEIAVMDVAHPSPLGVRTRARTLALQRLQRAASPARAPPAAADPGAGSYLQLRNRRLAKPPAAAFRPKPGAGAAEAKNTRQRQAASSANSASAAKSFSKKGGKGKQAPAPEASLARVGAEASFGENVLEELEARDRSVRETTPCSLMNESEITGTPGSTTRRITASNRRTRSTAPGGIPTVEEMEEFFADAEQLQQRMFTEKYNFDPVNDCPLPGRYEWVKLDC